jgi:hypothetical protein
MMREYREKKRKRVVLFVERENSGDSTKTNRKRTQMMKQIKEFNVYSKNFSIYLYATFYEVFSMIMMPLFLKYFIIQSLKCHGQLKTAA